MAATPDTPEKQRIAWTLRMAGMTYQEISQQLHNGEPLYKDDSGAWRAVQAYQSSMRLDDSLTQQRAVQLARYDALQRVVWRKALTGDIPAMKLALEVMKAREKLLGVQGYVPPEANQDPLDELAARRDAG